jgi:hypothetical protein
VHSIFHFLAIADTLGFNWESNAELISLSLIMVLAFKVSSGVTEKVGILVGWECNRDHEYVQPFIQD